ncbi:peptidase inhibitor family I36 protein [Nocardia yamanashiensis]|uniref:peptidase inhibitor family I36 protein n=1 Tax=Nocardia yamanashiensis TaxID=209247 RepID=UPI001E39C9A9|nr:peptidase inhibitor family I36 protein [Nocardia yamanashiensis]UGT44333.1 peptidase inhibitor family I36 protein [Nocardia yamanashiensis]
MTRIVALLTLLVLSVGVTGCKQADQDQIVKKAEETTCELVVPVVDYIATTLRAGRTVQTAAVAAVATVAGIALTAACQVFVENLNAEPDKDQPVVVVTGKGGNDLTVSGKTLPAKVEDMCKTKGGCDGFDRCPDKKICLFTGSDGNGKMSLFAEGSPDLRGQHIDAATVSVLNRTGTFVTLFDRYDYRGDTYRVEKGTKGDLPNSWSARAHSIHVGALPTSTPASSSTTTTTTTTPVTTTSAVPSSSTVERTPAGSSGVVTTTK